MNLPNIWRVHIPRRVAKTVKKFLRDDQNRILEILRDFERDPWLGDIQKIKGGDNEWRRRVGNYRIFYSINQKIKLIEIKEIERRASNTY